MYDVIHICFNVRDIFIDADSYYNLIYHQNILLPFIYFM
jgi:hypothetical protein